MIGRKGKVMGIFLFILFAVGLFSMAALAADMDYLKHNSQALDVNDDNDYAGFRLLDDAVKDKEVILAGECHSMAINEALRFKFLKYLNKKFGVRYYLEETGYSDTCLINSYLDTGNTEILDKLFDGLYTTPAWSQESYDFFRKVYALNKTLPKEKRIRFVGVDIQHQWGTGIWHLNTLLPKNDAPKEIREMINQLADIYKSGKVDRQKIEEFCRALGSDLKAKRPIYKSYFGNKFFEFEMAVDNILNGIDAYSHGTNSVEWLQSREGSACANFEKLYAHLPKGKYFGQWGRWHTQQKTDDGITRLAVYLKSSASPVKGRVLSINYCYQNCFYLANNPYRKAELNDSEEIIPRLEANAPSDVTLFRLNNTNSPFTKEIEYYQYALLIKNAGPNSFLMGEDVDSLKKNQQALQPTENAGNTDFQLLDGALADKEIFLAGEMYGLKMNEELRFRLLKYLQQKAGVKYYLGQFGYSDGWLLNKYLETGDAKLLKKFYAGRVDMPDWTNENYEFWQKVYALNQTLPQNERIKAVGVDIQVDYKLAIEHLNTLLPKKDAPASILPVINGLKNIYASSLYDEKEIRDFTKILQDSIAGDGAKQEIYKEYLNENYLDFILAAKSLSDLFDFIDSTSEGLNEAYDEENCSYLREEIAFQNFQLVYPTLPKGKYFGQFTRERIGPKPSKTAVYFRFGTLLNGTGSPVGNKVLSIKYFYGDSDLTFDSSQDIVAILNKAAANELTLFKIAGKHEPFANANFQYAVLVKDLQDAKLFNVK